MFGFLKRDPAAKLRQRYETLMAEAVERQRNGDIRGFAQKSDEAEAVARELAELEASGSR